MLTRSIDRNLPRTDSLSQASWLDQWCRARVHAALRGLRGARLELREDGGAHLFGDTDGPRAVVHITRPRAYRAMALNGALGAGEAYIAGDWMCSDLPELLRIFAVHEAAFDRVDRCLAGLAGPVRALLNLVDRNTRDASRRNIAAHYDLSNEFFSLWLDPSMTYSAGVFEQPNATLQQASIAKLDRVCRRLNLRPGDRVVEIGGGWGSFALHAAGQYGCRVTTTTISREQHQLTTERVAAAGLADRVTVLNIDYRDLRGEFDKLASIEMIEAIGWRQYDRFFRKIATLLAPHGAACIQTITVADRFYKHARADVDFIKRYVFPGSTIPSIGAIAAAIARTRDLAIRSVEDFGEHYAHTLKLWREQFLAARPRVRALGFDDAFMRMWEFYLCYCEAGFRERTIGVSHVLMTKPGWRTPAIDDPNPAATRQH